MINNQLYATQVQTDVKKQLINLDHQATQHRRATAAQLACMIILLVSAVLINASFTLQASNRLGTAMQHFLSNPFDLFLTVIMIMAFSLSWIWWVKDMKYQQIKPQFTDLYENHTELINNTAELTELTAHYKNQIQLATHYNILNNVIALGVIAGFVLHQLNAS